MHWRSLTMTAEVPPDDRGFAYGDGLFETIAMRTGRLRLRERHLARLRLGARRLALPLPDDARLADFVDACVADPPCDPERAVLKLLASRGDGPRGYRRPPHPRPRILVGMASSPPPARGHYESGVVVRWCRTRLGRNPSLAGIKHLNRLEQVLARSEWEEEDVAEGLMLDAEGLVVCGTMSNLFLVRAARLLTPAMTHAGVAGIMRETVLRTAHELGLAAEVREIRPEEVVTAEEVFLTNSQFVLWPVRRVGARDKEVGDITRSLMQALEQRGLSEW